MGKSEWIRREENGVSAELCVCTTFAQIYFLSIPGIQLMNLYKLYFERFNWKAFIAKLLYEGL